MDKNALKPVIEALIFAADHPVSFERILGVLEGESRDDIKGALKELIEDYRGARRGVYIEEVSGGYQMRTQSEYSSWIKRLFKIGMQKISKASLETLAMIAYKQPITRAELEGIRGVDSSGVLATLLERRLAKIVGRKDEPGRPIVYGTTKEFLEVFSLKDLSHLPTLKDIESLEEKEIEERYLTGENEGANPEDNSQGRDNIKKEGGGDDPGGEGQGQ